MDANITASNYVSQAEYGLKQFFKTHLHGHADDITRFESSMIKPINDSVHFALPDGGALFDDNLKGLEGQKLRLPFKKVIIQYYAGDNPIGDPAWEVQPCPKRVVFAQEYSKEFLVENGIEAGLVDFSDYWIAVTACCFYSNIKRWLPMPVGAFTPSDWERRGSDEFETQDMNGNIRPAKENEKGLITIPFVISKLMYEMSEKKFGADEAMRMFMYDIGGEVSVVYELCEALSCKNVSHEPIESVNLAANAKRIRRGKLPIYETRTLFIKAPNIVREREESNPSGRASPRFHLRRGHIRRLESGNIWVNSAVVGRKENGVIDKNYAVIH